MKFKKTILLLLITVLFAAAIYYFEFVQKEKSKNAQEISNTIFKLKPEDVNYLQIQTHNEIKNQMVTLQKTEKGWQLSDPLQDSADQSVVNDLLKLFSEQKMQNIETQNVQNLTEFGLDIPVATFIWKNNQGASEKIQIGSQKNFEGLSFAKLNDEPQVRIVQSTWLTKSEQNLTYYREKRHYREDLATLNKIKIKSVNDDFSLEKKDSLWVSSKFSEYNLDQNKVRQMIKDFSEATIQDYISEGDPSEKEKTEKGLLHAPVKIEFENNNNQWSSELNLNDKDKTLYALTSRPTFLVKLDISRWEKFANVTLDSLRDRKTLMTFSIIDVQKVYTKVNSKETEFNNENKTWLLKSKLPESTEFLPIQAEKVLDDVHNLEISEFIDLELAKKFEGNNMIILKSSNDELIFQLNWGPLIKMKFQGVEKEVYLARTQLSKNIFVIDKSKIEALNIDRIYKKIEEKPADKTTDKPATEKVNL
jgi:hypothetical protein